MQKESINGFNLSPQQTQLWLLQGADQSLSYRAQCACLIEGSLNIEALDEALQRVVMRHEILRTTFHSLPGMPMPIQVVHETGAALVMHYDLSGLDTLEQELKINSLYREVGRLPFNLEEGPVLQASLVALSPSKHVLVVSLSSLFADAAGLENLINEISQSYAAALHDAELSQEAIQYIDCSEWMNEVSVAEDAVIGREYWKNKDISSLNALELPFEHQPSGKLGFWPEVLILELDDNIASAIERLASHYQTSTSAFALACWEVLLWRLSSQPNLTIGIAADGRKYDDLKGALGLFLRYLPLQTRLADDIIFTDVLRQVDQAMREALAWQECFTWAQIGKPAGGASKAEFFPYCYEFETSPAKYYASDTSFSIYWRNVCVDRFKIKLLCIKTQAALVTELHYDSHLFHLDDIKRLAAQFHKLLESAVEASHAEISNLDVLSNAERRQLLYEFNNTKVDYLNDACIHRLFELQAEKTPEAVAVVFEEQQLSYAQLNSQANELAHFLIHLGVGPDSLVGICAERSIEMIVGLMGILKAGGAYVPVDPQYPAERIAYMLEDSGVRLLLTQEQIAGSLPQTAARVVILGAEKEAIGRSSQKNPEVEMSRENLAYVIYTSGSTGKPKGVMISHRAICNRLLWMQTSMPLDESDRVLQKTSMSFDASVWEIFEPLIAGASVVMAEPGGQQDAAYLVRVIAEQKVTTLQVVPTMLAVMMGEQGVEELESLRRVYSGGEALREELRQEYDKKMRAELHNLYGPTECAIDATHERIGGERQQEQEAGEVTIGKPIGNVRVHILDKRKRMVGVGVAGEIHIGGEGIARGYYKKAEMTAERFIPNPYGGEEGGRLYKTGDIGRYRGDGRIEYMGREDEQVKVRGNRVEMGEIEEAVREIEGVREAVVVMREEGGEQRLIGYVVEEERGEGGEREREIRRRIKQKLPEYMVPAVIVMLDELPLLPNGKLNRQALMNYDGLRSRPKSEYAAPNNPTEEIMESIWMDILQIDRLDINDNFFEVGGHSLSAMQLITRVRQVFQVEIPIRSLFDAPTLAQLSQKVEEARGAINTLQTMPIERASRDEELPLSFAQQRLWFLDRLEPDTSVYNLPTAIRLEGGLDVAAMQQSFNQIMRRHEVLRTRFAEVEGRPVQVIHTSYDLSLPVIDLSTIAENAREAEMRRLAEEEARNPFDLFLGPMLRTCLIRLAEQEHVVLFTMHHIVSDGWSVGVLVQEIGALYTAYSQQQATMLAEPPIQYADFATWQRLWLRGELLETQLTYWKKQLSGRLPGLELPTDRPRPFVQTFCGGHESFAVPLSLAAALKDLSRREGVTLFMTLLAAFKTLLYKYTGQEDILIGTPIANRNRAEIENLIGFFANTLILRTDLSGNPAFTELMRRVRDMALDAYGNQDLPFEKLVEVLQPERNRSHNPLFQVCFDFHDAQIKTLDLPGLTLSPIKISGETAKFDLVLNMWTSEQGLMGVFEYNTDLFDQTRIEQMLRHFTNILEEVSANSEQRLLDISVGDAQSDSQLEASSLLLTDEAQHFDFLF